ncbi:unnamed protein product [Phyllotreta striolata]|uniref:Major facilitator superfamily (MFS) profile domain-containing protein n=1 Tax=Phyllotreta striolata TaxID=444603 RepID=A0A9N9XLF7_PHYSR|nr:unnamed protein product [Phyllotreta striolata]
MTFLSGQGQAWSSPCIPKLFGEVDPETNPLGRPASIQEISWITSLHNLGAIACIPFCAMMANKFGKKRTLIFFGTLQMLSNIILVFANNVVLFYIARFLIGLGTGCAFTLIQPYVVEMVEVGHRGRAFSCTYWMAALGMESVFLIGPSVTIRTLALISLIPSIVFMACFGKFSTESASYFVKKSDMQKAEGILKKTRLKDDGIADELSNLITTINGDSGNSFGQMLKTKVNFMAMLIGVGFVWTSRCLPKLTGLVDPEHNPLGRIASVPEISWITSLHFLGIIASILTCGVVERKCGKKKTLLIFAISHLISSIILIFADSIAHFYVARFLFGLGTGVGSTLIPLYIMDIASPKNRGKACSIFSWMMTLGQDLLLIIGPFVTIRTIAILCIGLSVVFFVMFGKFAPESPSNGIASKHDSIESEVILNQRNEQPRVCIEDFENKRLSLWKILKTKTKSCLLAVILMFFQQVSGLNCINAYQQTILTEYKLSLPADISVMINGLLQFLPIIMITKTIDSWGRKKLMMISYAGVGLSLLILATYLNLQKKNVSLTSLHWLPIVCIILYSFCCKLGPGAVTFMVCIEMLPPNSAVIMFSFIMLVLYFMTFIITYSFPFLWHHLGLEMVFYAFSCGAALAMIFVYFVIPETKGKTLVEIQKALRRKSAV